MWHDAYTMAAAKQEKVRQYAKSIGITTAEAVDILKHLGTGKAHGNGAISSTDKKLLKKVIKSGKWNGKKQKKKNGNGNKKHIDPEVFEKLTCFGMSIEKAAIILGVAKSTIHDRMNAEPELRLAYERGKAKKEAKLIKTAYDMAIGGNKTMIIFLLKTKHGFIENAQVEDIETIQEKARVFMQQSRAEGFQ